MSIVSQVLRATLPIGQFWRVPIGVHWSWILGLAFWVSRAADFYQVRRWAIADVAILFLLVLLHEMGHVCAARSLKRPVSRIMLWPWGGTAAVDAGGRWYSKLLVAAGGPIINVLLIPLLHWLAYGPGARHGGDLAMLAWHAYLANAGLLILNLLPIFPLDGGRILEALVQAVVGIEWSMLACSILAGLLAALVAIWTLSKRDFITAGFFLPILGLNVLQLMLSVAYLRMRRRHGIHTSARCPQCHARPLIGTTGQCAACGQGFNALLDDGRCWNCGNPPGLVKCLYCRTESDATAWFKRAGGVMRKQVITAPAGAPG